MCSATTACTLSQRHAATSGSMRAAASALHLPRQRHRDRGENQYSADDGKRVAESQHQGLVLDGLAERDDRLLMRGGGVGDTVRQEVLSRLGYPFAHFLAAECHRLADDVGMKLLALGDH